MFYFAFDINVIILNIHLSTQYIIMNQEIFQAVKVFTEFLLCTLEYQDITLPNKLHYKTATLFHFKSSS